MQYRCVIAIPSIGRFKIKLAMVNGHIICVQYFFYPNRIFRQEYFQITMPHQVKINDGQFPFQFLVVVVVVVNTVVLD